MTWPEIILNRLNLSTQIKTIIIDHLGLLADSNFTEYLTERGFTWGLGQDVQSVLHLLKTGQLVIIPNTLELPDYLKKQTTIIHFDIQKLPIEIEPSIIDRLSDQQLKALIEFVTNTGLLQLINKFNYKKYLENAERYYWQKEQKELEIEILKQCQSAKSYNDLLNLGKLWGRLVYLDYQLNQLPNTEILDQVDQITEHFVLNYVIRDAFYETSSNLKTVDKIIPHIRTRHPQKLALVCFDAMGVAEWFLLKQYLKSDGFQFNERMLFALIPTMTRISRSAIFYGNAEQVYQLNAPNEDKAFTENFSDYTVRSFREGELSSAEQLLGIDAIKLVYNVFDDLAHKTILPPSETTKHLYFKNVLNYLAKSGIKDELNLLITNGFKVWFCSDHGSVVAKGNGQKIDKYLIEASSKRATIVEKSDLVKFYDVNTYEIPFVQGKMVLLAKGRTCFSTKNKMEITHGGITLDELIVPFIEVKN